ncbi:acyl-CoA dehydrogenase family protein [Streptomyces sp. XM83C]|jgi:alkylation response protein AidB-like acyl-CoA dehydrogenase|uniref:Acyl-CoA dehydrogenase family protein n=1 Tax=Streptomyces thermocoprophilus TaxID=78356 RepID=A0ABV5VGR5_9ACTN|nr:acyl-CoA dehydrogenase family protein [Streptomyces sp. XM83C]MCK1823117.1 acyl-CoA dehydrogenase family protein [Streptomyces sp. XM83C]
MTTALPTLDRSAVRSFVDTYIVPEADRWDRDGAIPQDLLDRIAEAGLWAPFLPAEAGGADVDMVRLGELHEEVGRGCSSVRSLLTVHTMASWAVQRWGTAEQRERWLPDLAAGRVLGAFCLSEPGAGSDAVGITTTATAHGGNWLLNGVKTWITNGARADLFLVFARTGTSIAAFLVPRTAPGVRVEAIDDMLGTRASMPARITFDDVLLGPDALLGPSGFTSGMVLTGVLDLGRYSVAAGSVGIVQACLEACAGHARRRTTGGQPLAERQLIRSKLSDMVTDVRAARLLVAEAGRLKDAGDSATLMATWVAKYFASTAAARHASEAVQVHGALGCAPGSPVARFYRDAKVMEIIEGSNEIQRITIAEEAFRSPYTGRTDD